MKMIAPNIAIPIVKPIAFATSKTRERKSVSGTIGSSARRSCQTNAASSTTPAIPRPMIVDEPHGYWLPPQVVSRMSAPTPPVSSPAPRKSILWRVVGVCRCSLKTTIAIASAPIGMLT